MPHTSLAHSMKGENMIEYKLFFDGSGICGDREALTLADTVALRFSGDGVKTRLGIISDNAQERFFNISENKTEISASAFAQGENRLTVYGKGKRWKCEPLLRCENKISPRGIDSAEEISHFKSEYEMLSTRLALCESRLYSLEEKIEKQILF